MFFKQEEYIIHLFFKCSTAILVWNKVSPWLWAVVQMDYAKKYHFIHFITLMKGKTSKKVEEFSLVNYFVFVVEELWCSIQRSNKGVISEVHGILESIKIIYITYLGLY